MWRGFFCVRQSSYPYIFIIFADMKARCNFIVLLLGFLAACTRPSQAPELVEGPSPELVAVDSLMWRQPDSALALLLPWFDSVAVPVEYDLHYAHLLLSELLYKNYYEQTNRAELLQSEAYFDSISLIINNRPRIPWSHCGPSFRECGTQSPQTKDNIAFLSARAHYMDGVGHYECDSLVPACREYLKALEIMEGHFGEKELTGHRALFMALINTRLGGLFSERFITEPAICFHKKALKSCLLEQTSSLGISKNLYRIGIQFDKSGELDSAFYYYQAALQALPDTNNVVYRDINTSKLYSEYHIDHDLEKALDGLQLMFKFADDADEKLTRSLPIGGILYEEQLFDSAIAYLENVFRQSTKELSRIQAAEYLRDIYKKKGIHTDEYSSFLSQYTVSSFEQKLVQSQLADAFQTYLQNKKDNLYKTKIDRGRKLGVIGAVLLLALASSILVFIFRHKLRKQQLLSDMRHAISLNRLLSSNQQLEKENKRILKDMCERDATSNLPFVKGNHGDYAALLQEPICLNLKQRFGNVDIVTTNKASAYSNLAITAKEKHRLADAVGKHCPDYDKILLSSYPKLKAADLETCRLLLIGLSEQQIAVLLQIDYSTIWRRVKKLKGIMGFVDAQKHLKRILFEP